MMTDNEFEVYKHLETHLQVTLESVGDISNLSNIWPSDKRRLNELLAARQALHNFLQNRSQST